jgi:hypothetical protein
MRGFMERAILQGEEGLSRGGGAAGAVVVDPAKGEIVAEAYDEAHAAP